jgi:cytoskeletal protein RodZ
VGVVLVVLVGGFFLVRQLGGSDDVTTTPPTTPNPTTSSPAATTPSPSVTTSSAPVSPTVSQSPTTKPPTLAFTVVGSSSYITVRIPGGKTLVSRLFKKGAKASFDQKTLTVVNGRPSAVRFVVNGKPRKPGPSTQTEIFTVHRA